MTERGAGSVGKPLVTRRGAAHHEQGVGKLMLGRDIQCFANEAGIGFHLAGNQRLCQRVGFERGDYRVRFVAPVAVPQICPVM